MAITEQLEQLKQVKQDIKQSLINKEVDMSNVPFTSYAEKIEGMSNIKKLLPSEMTDAGNIFSQGTSYMIGRTGSAGQSKERTASFNPIQIVGIVGGGNWSNDGGGTSGGSGSFHMYLTDEDGVESECTFDTINAWYVPSNPSKKYKSIRCRINYSSGASQVIATLAPTSIFYK